MANESRIENCSQQYYLNYIPVFYSCIHVKVFIIDFSSFSFPMYVNTFLYFLQTLFFFCYLKRFSNVLVLLTIITEVIYQNNFCDKVSWTFPEYTANKRFQRVNNIWLMYDTFNSIRSIFYIKVLFPDLSLINLSNIASGKSSRSSVLVNEIHVLGMSTNNLTSES